jgi:hypothetical protein
MVTERREPPIPNPVALKCNAAALRRAESHASRTCTVKTNSHQNSHQTILASLISRGQFNLNSLFCWCREGGSNPHDRKGRRILSPLRLPVPPSRHNFYAIHSIVGASIFFFRTILVEAVVADLIVTLTTELSAFGCFLVARRSLMCTAKHLLYCTVSHQFCNYANIHPRDPSLDRTCGDKAFGGS